MPQDLPGFYFNAEKHRCFPIEDPTPGSSRPSSTSAAAKKSAQTSTREMDLCWVTYVRASKLLQIRELYGNVILFKNRKRNFKEEFRKIQVSQPAIMHGLLSKKTKQSTAQFLGQFTVCKRFTLNGIRCVLHKIVWKAVYYNRK